MVWWSHFKLILRLLPGAKSIIYGQSMQKLPIVKLAFKLISASSILQRESSFIDNLLVRIHLIIVMISVDRPCAMGV